MKIEYNNLKDELSKLSDNYIEDFDKIIRELKTVAKLGLRTFTFTNLSQSTVDKLIAEGLSVISNTYHEGITYYSVKW